MSGGPSGAPLLHVEGLRVRYPVRRGLGRRVWLTAVDGVGFDVAAGETFGLVGESGCGKSTLARTLLRLQEPAAGRVRFDGLDWLALRGSALRTARPRMQIVFQDPGRSLDPRCTVLETVGAGIRAHEALAPRAVEGRVRGLLDRVGLDPDALQRRPHEFSGGERQRIGLARALAPGPRLLVLDEPVSSLDVSVQAQVINLLLELQRGEGLAYVFISHDLGVVERLSDRLAVMYLGRFVEWGPASSVFTAPRHPYTRALLAAASPAAAPSDATGEPPSPLSPPGGCPFHPRCPLAEERCRTEPPPAVRVGEDHGAVCHLAEEA